MFRLVVFAVIMGIAGWIVHLIFILASLKSKKKGLIEIYYNQYHELYPEIILIIIILLFQIVIVYNIMNGF